MPYDDLEDLDDDALQAELERRQGNQQGRNPLRDVLNKTEKDLKEAQTAAAANADAVRELAFLKAGINPDADPKLKAFAKTYEGPLDPDQIKAAAVTDGWIQAPDPDPDLAQAAQAAKAASGGDVETPLSKEAEHLNAILTAPSQEAALEAYRLAGGAVKDPFAQ